MERTAQPSPEGNRNEKSLLRQSELHPEYLGKNIFQAIFAGNLRQKAQQAGKDVIYSL